MQAVSVSYVLLKTMKRLHLLKIFLITLIQSTGEAKRIPSFAGPYRVIARRFSNVSEEYKSQGDFWARIRIQSTNPGRVPYGWGRAYNRIPIDDNIRVFIMIHLWNNNEWKKNAFQLNFAHACSDALYHAGSLLRLLYGEDGTKCPVPPGDREIPNKTLELVFPQFPVFPYGRYLFVLIGFVKNRVAGIHTLEVDAIPKV